MYCSFPVLIYFHSSLPLCLRQGHKKCTGELTKNQEGKFSKKIKNLIFKWHWLVVKQSGISAPAVAATAMCNLRETPSKVFLPTQSKLDKKRRILHLYQNLTVKKNGKAYRLFENQKDIRKNKALFFGGSCPKDLFLPVARLSRRM